MEIQDFFKGQGSWLSLSQVIIYVYIASDQVFNKDIHWQVTNVYWEPPVLDPGLLINHWNPQMNPADKQGHTNSVLWISSPAPFYISVLYVSRRWGDVFI